MLTCPQPLGGLLARMAVSAPEYTKGKFKLHKLKEVRPSTRICYSAVYTNHLIDRGYGCGGC